MSMDMDELCGLLQEIDEDGEGLGEWEIGFVESMLRKLENAAYVFSVNEGKKIRQIHEERVDVQE